MVMVGSGRVREHLFGRIMQTNRSYRPRVLDCTYLATGLGFVPRESELRFARADGRSPGTGVGDGEPQKHPDPYAEALGLTSPPPAQQCCGCLTPGSPASSVHSEVTDLSERIRSPHQDRPLSP
jgi:hypothetical protein